MTVIVTVTLATEPTLAQGGQFGVQGRADAARKMIVLAVQQAISSLPPTSGQSFVYEYDRELDSWVSSEQLGPTSFRSTRTVGKGKLTFRVATSYFELDDSFGPVEYRVDGPLADEFLEAFGLDPDQGLLTRFGLDAEANVGLFNLSASYGILHNIEVSLNLPLVITRASGSEVFVENPDRPGLAGGVPVDGEPFLVEPDRCAEGRLTGSCLLDEFLDEGRLGIAKRDFSNLPGVEFDDGTNFGVGRISLAVRVARRVAERLRLAFIPEIFFPSPSEDEFAGPNSAAILPRGVAEMKLDERQRLYLDVGYDYDFESKELGRFVWNVGTSIALAGVAFDLGIGGSQYSEGIKWTPDTATFNDVKGRTNKITILGDNELGTTFLDFIGGIKLQLAEQLVLSGAVDVPLNNEGFRPDVLGTVAVEVSF